jgi:hypothetical protein
MTPATLRDSFCVTAGALAHDDVVLTLVLEASPAPAVQVRIDGQPAAAADVFADHVQGSIDPGAWKAGRATCTIALDAAPLRGHVVSRHRSAWTWEARPNGHDALPLGSSEHLVFVIADSPTFPWTAAALPPQDAVRPWPGALALACDFAAGASSAADIPSRIAGAVSGLEHVPGNGWRYNSGVSTYLNPGIGTPFWFLAALFISAARDLDPGLPHVLSCFEASAVVLTFSNVLGCDLKQILIELEDCSDFSLNAVWPLGQSPQMDVNFSRHVIACDTASGGAATLRAYDPILRLDTDSHPAAKPFAFAFPTAMPIGGSKSLPGQGAYLPQLIKSTKLSSSKAVGMAPLQIATPGETETFDPCLNTRWGTSLNELRDLTDHGAPLRRMPLELEGFKAYAATTVPAPPALRKKLPPVPTRTRSLYKSEKQDDPAAAGVALLADVWTGDRVATQSFMAELLTMAEQPPRRIEHPAGIVYVAADDGTVWILLDGATVRVTSVGRRPVDVVEILKSAKWG